MVETYFVSKNNFENYENDNRILTKTVRPNIKATQTVARAIRLRIPEAHTMNPTMTPKL